MKKQGRFEAKSPAPAPKKKHKNRQGKLLLSLVSSIVSLLLCCTMFLGTTMAWFTDEVTSAGNQITIGELKVDILHGSTSLRDNTDAKVFKGDIKWAPNHVEVRTLTVKNEGSLELTYILNLLMDADEASVAKYFNVYVKKDVNETSKTKWTYDDVKDWDNVGTLEEIFTGGKSVFKGTLAPAGSNGTTAETYAIAIHMAPNIKDESIYNKTLSLNIKLNAYQSDMPEDEIEFSSETAEYTGEQNAPIVFSGGTLILDNVTLEATENTPAVELTGNTKVIIKGTTTLTGGSGIYVAEGVKLDLSGDTLITKGNAGVDANGGGNGIGGKGSINIHDLTSLTAEGYGIHGFGIGGAVSSITISDTTIEKVQGGYVQQNFVSDTSYGKSEPEGGAAIGSSVNGAVITLDNVTIKEALGGSKSAGIGATFHTGVTINITDSTIEKVVGGNASAGIGGSRIASGDATSQNVTINIDNSTINAEGGQFAAGIGSGYDTYCHTPDIAPVHTINITGNSNITATGGKYGAGIGTGYHVAGLAGKIEETVTVNATAGESREKYTYAMNVGFGVIDHSKEAGEGNTSSFEYNGTTITVNNATLVTASSEG